MERDAFRPFGAAQLYRSAVVRSYMNQVDAYLSSWMLAIRDDELSTASVAVGVE